jgi:hypothetical protein
MNVECIKSCTNVLLADGDSVQIQGQFYPLDEWLGQINPSALDEGALNGARPTTDHVSSPNARVLSVALIGSLEGAEPHIKKEPSAEGTLGLGLGLVQVGHPPPSPLRTTCRCPAAAAAVAAAPSAVPIVSRYLPTSFFLIYVVFLGVSSQGECRNTISPCPKLFTKQLRESNPIGGGGG